MHRNHTHEARIVERMDVLGYRTHKGGVPLNEQAQELRVIERVLQDESSLPKRHDESFKVLMRRARRR
jgi:hypothetical protein